MANTNLAFQTLGAAKPPVPAWVSLSGQAAPLAAFVVFLAPYPTIRKMMVEKSVGQMPLLPYSSMFVNGFVWSVYGILKREQKVYITNIIGCVLGLYYYIQFDSICPPTAKNLPYTKNHHARFTTMILGLTSACAVLAPISLSTEFIGKLGIFFCIVLFGSPLSSLKNVIATKSAKTIPLPFTLTCCINCFLWSVFGILEANDFNIYFPNVLGLILGVLQLFLLFIYGNGPPKISEDTVQLPL